MKLLLKFLGAGALAAAVNFLSRFIFSEFMPFEYAVLVAYMSGMVVAFLLFTGKVFKNPSTSKSTQVFRFVLVNILGAVQTWIFSTLFIHTIFKYGEPSQEALAHLTAMSLVTVSSYFLHRFYTFRNSVDSTQV